VSLSRPPRSGPYQEVKNIKISWDGLQEKDSKQYVEVIKIAGDVPDGYSWEDAYRIYKYTSECITYSKEEINCTSVSALTAYMTHTGRCGEFARLEVSLSRAAGIPAQMIVGIVMPDLVFYGASKTQTGDHPGESHAWAEIFTEGFWTIADPSVGSDYLKRLKFGRNDGRYLSYGEFEQERKAYVKILEWTASRGKIIDRKHASLKFVAATDGDAVIVNPTVTVRKGWDGRWSSAILTLAITTFVLCKLRNRFIL
jgi:hypothetical protein